MNREEKINMIRDLARSADLDPAGHVFIVQRGGKHYISDGKKIGKELTPEAEARIRKVKVFIDEEDLNA